MPKGERNYWTNDQAFLVMLRAGYQPLVKYPGDNVPWPCRCMTCGRTSRPHRNSVARTNGTRCGYCRKHRVDPDEAEALMLAKGFTPREPYPGAIKPWLCRHTCGREVRVTYTSVKNTIARSGGCGWCSGRLQDDADLVTIMNAFNLDPLVPYPGDGPPWKARHRDCGRVVYPRLGRLKAGHVGPCKYCGRRGVDPNEAAEFMRSKGLEPQIPYPGTGKPWLCRHTCGRQVSPSYGSVVSGQGGCAPCGWAASAAARAVRVDVAASVFAEANLQPIGSFPGARKKWDARCRGCGTIRSYTYAYVRQGKVGTCRTCPRNQQENQGPPRPTRSAQQLPRVLAMLEQNEFDVLEHRPFRGTSFPLTVRCRRCDQDVTVNVAEMLQRRGGRGCPVCNTFKPVDQDKAASELRDRGFEAQEPYPGAANAWLVRHIACGELLEVSRNSLQGNTMRGSTGCLHCTRKCKKGCPCAVRTGTPSDGAALDFARREGARQPKRTSDEESVRAEMINAGAMPLEPCPGAQKPWKCRCLAGGCKETITPMLASVRAGQRACAYCSGHYIRQRDVYDALSTMRLRALEPFPGKRDAAWSVECLVCGAKFTQRYRNMRAGTGGCVCQRSGRLEAAESGATYLRDVHNVTPLEVVRNTYEAIRCRCDGCGSEISVRVRNLRSGTQKNACKHCSGTCAKTCTCAVRLGVVDSTSTNRRLPSPTLSRSVGHAVGREI